MSLLVLFNQGGAGSPFVPAAIPAVMLADVWTPRAPLRGMFASSAAMSAPVNIGPGGLRGVNVSTVAVSNVWLPSTTIKNPLRTTPP